jgi:spectinomycin phosphotransferase
MLEKPTISDEKIVACLQAEYGLSVAEIEFLPLGADLNTAVYRAVTQAKQPYFVKLRGGIFEEMAVAIPKFLWDQGLEQIIAPLATTAGRLWAELAAFKVFLYPFIDGRNGYQVALSEQQWLVFGAALKKIHELALPADLANSLQRETFSGHWRETVRAFLERAESDVFDEPVAAKLAVLLKTRRTEILDLIRRAERLALILQARAADFVLCHADIHAGNLLIQADGTFYIVDWDNPILAPKERDLMFIGNAQGFIGYTPAQEETLFYRGYGQAQIDQEALAYYRYERILVDIAAYCEQLLLTDDGGEDREQALVYVSSNFLPGNTIDLACQSDKTHLNG